MMTSCGLTGCVYLVWIGERLNSEVHVIQVHYWRGDDLSKSEKVAKVALIGAGKMGEGIIAGLLKSGVYRPEQIVAYEVLEDRAKYISRTYKIECVTDVKKAVSFADISLIAVKPADVIKVLDAVAPVMKPPKILVSIAAGVTLDFYRKHLPKDVPIIRVMPNMAVLVREGMVTYCPSDNVTKEQLNTAVEMLSLIGRVVRLDEKYLNLATGLVGSGPAYIYLIIEGLADAGVRLGLPKDISTMLAAQTTLGAAKMVVETGEHPAKLKDMVVTPAGTTIEGLLELEKAGIKASLIMAVTRAAERAKELGPPV
jgi:pyrroline-5-carboxylate reductase